MSSSTASKKKTPVAVSEAIKKLGASDQGESRSRRCRVMTVIRLFIKYIYCGLFLFSSLSLIVSIHPPPRPPLLYYHLSHDIPNARREVAVQTYIAGLKSTIDDLESQLSRFNAGKEDDNNDIDDLGYEVINEDDDDDDDVGGGDAHAHFHGHERCTNDHGHADNHHHHHHREKEGEHDASSKKTTPKWKGTSPDDASAAPFGGTWDAESSVDATAPPPEEGGEGGEGEDMPPMYAGDESTDDYDRAASAKEAASDLKSSGDHASALEKYTEAVISAPPSALLLANRAHCLFSLGRHSAAARDCDAALEINPDSAKALRIRGECRASMGMYQLALKDLSAAQQADYDDEAAKMLKGVTEKVKELDAQVVKRRNAEEKKMREKAEGIRKAREEARMEAEKESRREAKEEEEKEKKKDERRRKAAAAAGMGGGMPGAGGGMPGMGGGMEGMMAGLMVSGSSRQSLVRPAFPSFYNFSFVRAVHEFFRENRPISPPN